MTSKQMRARIIELEGEVAELSETVNGTMLNYEHLLSESKTECQKLKQQIERNSIPQKKFSATCAMRFPPEITAIRHRSIGAIAATWSSVRLVGINIKSERTKTAVRIGRDAIALESRCGAEIIQQLTRVNDAI